MRLLIPLDGSRLAEHAVSYVSALLPMGVSAVQLVSVVGEAESRSTRGQEALDREVHVLTSYLGELAEDLQVKTGVEVTFKVVRGTPATAILEEAEALQPEMLVISTHGASGLQRWRVGSVADKVVRGATCPTLVIGPGAARHEEALESRILPAFNTILVPLDGSETAEQALPVGAGLAEASGAALHLVSVVSLGDLGVSATWAGFSPELDDEFSQEAKDYLKGVYAAQAWKCEVHEAVRFGTPADTLEEYIAANDIDMTVMASHGRGGFVRTALGSTTDRLIGAAACPVLIVRGQP